ncbi:MAG: PAS domain S-box protein [Candidatus Hydrothermarchaeales archaeon]
MSLLILFSVYSGSIITERKRAKEILRESEERFRQLAENLDDIFWLVDAKKNQMLYISPAYENICGRPCESLYEQPGSWLESVHPEDRESVNAAFERQSRGERQFDEEYRIVRPDGSVHWIWARAFLIKNELGEVYRVAGIAKDITSHKRAEEALRESEKRYRTLVETSSECICNLDLEGNFLYMSPAGLKSYGMSEDEVIGLHYTKLANPAYTGPLNETLKKAKKGESVQFHYESDTPSGSRWFESTLTPIKNDSGKVVSLLRISRDITERKKLERQLKEYSEQLEKKVGERTKELSESEEKYRSLFEHASDSIFIHDFEGRFLDVNGNACRRLGYTKEELLKMTIMDIDAPEFAENVPENIKKLKEQGEITIESEHIRKDGSFMPLEITARIIEYGGKKVIQSFARDITERKKAEEALRKAHDKLERRVEERTAELQTAIEQLRQEITERKKMEEALRESEEKYRLLVENANEAILVAQDGMFKFANPKATELSGYSKDELTSKPFVEFIHPDDREIVVERHLKRLKGEELPHVYPFRFIDKDANIKWLEINAVLITWEGRPATLNFLSDITERKRAEEEMKKRLMKFKLDERKLYLVKEPIPTLSIDAFKDLLKVGYLGLVISRTPDEEFKRVVEDGYKFLWLSEGGGEKALPPKLKEVKLRIENLPRKSAVLIDRLDYLVFKNGFNETLSFVQRLRELAYLGELVVIMSIDPSILSKQELRLLEKETREVEPLHKKRLPEDLLEILRFIYKQNTIGVKPSYTDIGIEIRISKPTVRKRIRHLAFAGYVMETKTGNRKVMELTERGRRLFLS